MTVMAIERKDTVTHWPASAQTRKGIMTGASSVDTVVMETARGTSPLARKLMTLDAVPLGQEPRRTMPTASSGVRPNTMTRA